MIERLEKSIKMGLRGKHIHIDPVKAVQGLTAETARMIPEKGNYSCWHYLYHIVFWQDLMLGALRKESVNRTLDLVMMRINGLGKVLEILSVCTMPHQKFLFQTYL